MALQAGLGAAQLMTGKKGQQAAQGSANRLTAQQVKELDTAFPLINQGEEQALQYDPAAQDQSAMQAFDTAANASAARDFGNAQLPLSLRGFSAGNASTDSTGFQQAVAGQRSAERGALAANLKSTDFSRKLTALDSAAMPAISAASSLAGPAATYQSQANQWDPSGSLSLIDIGTQKPWWLPRRKAITDSMPLVGMDAIPGSTVRADGSYGF